MELHNISTVFNEKPAEAGFSVALMQVFDYL
jgi:hypothetical protein